MTMIKPAATHYQNGGKDIFRFVTGNTVLEEAVKDGCYVGLYWSASNQVHRENVSAGMPRLDPVIYPAASFTLEVDGQSLHNRWNFTGCGEQPSGDGHTIFYCELSHKLRPVKVKVYTKLDGSPFITRWLTVTNTSDRPAALSRISPFSGILWHNEFNCPTGLETSLSKHREHPSPFSVAYLDGYNQSEEFNLRWVDMTEPNYTFSNCACQIYGAPYYIARNNISGESFYIALAWSAGYETKFSYNRTEKILSFETGPYGKAPLRVISPDETVCSPAVHIGPAHAGTDSIVADWYGHIRSSVIPQRRGRRRMYTAAARVVEQPGDWILREIDIAAEMGIEAYMVDAGWYGESFAGWWEHRGDWFEGPFLPPGGIAGIRDYCHDKGMLFGLWMEPEAITGNSKIYKEHPEYMSSYEPGGTKAGVMNLSDPGAAEYVTEAIKNVIIGKNLDFFKTDYNNRPYEGLATDRDGYAENNSWRHFEVLFAAYDEVIRQNPDIAMENCAGGGGRNDLGMLSRFSYCAESDFSQMPLSIRRINSMTLFIPPESICYYHNHMYQAHQLADIDTHLRVCLFTIPIFVGFGAQNADRSSVYFKKTKEYIGLAKGFCRPVLAEGAAVYHHTPYIGMVRQVPWCVLEYGMKNKSRGYCGIFRLDAGNDAYNLRLRGIDEGKNYRVTKMNSGSSFEVSGFVLANTGLQITLEGINTSELVLYQEI